MLARMRGIVAWGALTGYVLATIAVHALHEHHHTGQKARSAFAAVLPTHDKPTHGEPIHDECANSRSPLEHEHPDKHTPHAPHHQNEDDCPSCQYLAIKVLSSPRTVVLPCESVVWPATLPSVSLPKVAGPSLPHSRAPPRLS